MRFAKQKLARGFSLIEVMVAVIIIAVGMLGIAKIQAVAFSSTGVASKRSLAAVEAASLAASMHVNKGYWAAGLAPPVTSPIQIVGTTISDANLAIVADCTPGNQAPCKPPKLAAYDLQEWARSLNNLLPNDKATVTCTPNPAGPITCTIFITWTETAVSVNKQAAGGAMAAPDYTLLVEP